MGSHRDYDRTRVLQEATRARSRKRRRKAIALYRWVLAVEPGNPEIHAKIAPLLAETGQDFDAWISFRTAARTYLQSDRIDKALSLYREASQLLPHKLEVWLEMAELQRRRRREADAIQLFLEGRLQFRGWRKRPEAIHLLRRVLELEPGNVEVAIDLARLLARSRQSHEALSILERLAKGAEGTTLRRLRAAQFRISRTVGHAWLWLRSALQRGDEEISGSTGTGALVTSRSSASPRRVATRV